MSFWVAAVGIVKIKLEYQEQFGYLYDGQYHEITDNIMREFAEDYLITGEVSPLRCWSHLDYKDTWRGKYITSYVDGVFTFGHAYNHQRVDRLFGCDFSALMKQIGHIVELDCWVEDD